MSVRLENFTVTFNGEKVAIDELKIDYTQPDYHTIGSIWGCDVVASSTYTMEYTIKGRLDSEALNKMCYECVETKEDHPEKTLAQKLRDAELGDNDRLLQKHNVVNLDGTLTEQGKDLLLNILFESNEDDVVDALRAIEDAENED